MLVFPSFREFRREVLLPDTRRRGGRSGRACVHAVPRGRATSGTASIQCASRATGTGEAEALRSRSTLHLG